MTLVSLTFDDCLDTQLDQAIPILDEHGLKGTFFVDIGADCFGRRHREWGQAAARGHELGNHTIFHPAVSSKEWVTEGIAIESYTLDRMRRELVAANTVLSMLDGRARRSFAFPCSNPWLGKPGWPRRLLTRVGWERTRLMGWVDRNDLDFGSRLVDYTPLVRDLFDAARCGGTEASRLPQVPPDRHRVRGVAGDGATLAGLQAAIDAAVERDAWLVLVFHGVGGGHHLSCDREVFAELAASLGRRPRIEVATFGDAARRLWPA